MTDEQIIKALECCKSSNTLIACKNCPVLESGYCSHGKTYVSDFVLENVLDLINRQRAEIERLKTMNSELRIGLKVIKRTEIKKLWERLEKEIRYCTDVYGNSIQAINVECANRIVKEMVGE